MWRRHQRHADLYHRLMVKPSRVIPHFLVQISVVILILFLVVLKVAQGKSGCCLLGLLEDGSPFGLTWIASMVCLTQLSNRCLAYDGVHWDVIGMPKFGVLSFVWPCQQYFLWSQHFPESIYRSMSLLIPCINAYVHNPRSICLYEAFQTLNKLQRLDMVWS